jgi:hypothetical protein
MFTCGACSREIDRTDHVIIIENGMYCRETVLEGFDSIEAFVEQLRAWGEIE